MNAALLKRCFIAGSHALNAMKDYINELNVFPVPDGDTGTNMTMTLVSACREVLAVESEEMEPVCRAISGGALRGARGNSGVIMSQLLRGFMRSVREKSKLSVGDLVRATEKAVESAYKAVMAPKEGTILTVARGISEKAKSLSAETDMALFMKQVIGYGDEVLEKTPEMLPVLKQAGVVDSGGKGLMEFLHGVYAAFAGNEVLMEVPVIGQEAQESRRVDVSDIETANIRFGYCTEFIIKTKKPLTDAEGTEFKEFLESLGDSIVLVSDEDVVKIHVHTNEPGVVITKALTYGELSRLKIDNMREEHEERLFKDAESLAKKQKEEEEAKKTAYDPETAKDLGFVSVCSGEGLNALMKELGTDYVIGGGQTMNPCTEDFLNAIRHVNAKNVFLLPNNVNILMAAEQAAKMTKDRQVTVIPTLTVMEGITALLSMDPGESAQENRRAMEEARARVRTIEVTYAVRDTQFADNDIHRGDYMAISEKEILASGPDLNAVVKEAVRDAATDETGVVSIYYGEDIPEEEAEALGETIREGFPDAEVEVQNGGQPVYYYLISIE